MDRPNILWICTDSQRWDTLGCTGNPHVRTPHADRLAREGTLFEHCYAQNPLCQPSRANFLTGRYPVTTHLRQNGQDIPESEVLITKLLADAGYVCGLAGKFHLSACDHRIRNFGRAAKNWGRRPWHEFFRGTERRVDDGYSEFHWDHAPAGVNPSSAYTRWVDRKGGTFVREPREDQPLVGKGMPDELHQSTWCAEMTCDFLRGYADSDIPWLYSVNPFDPHFDFNPPDAFLEPYLDRLDEIPLPAWREGELAAKPAYQEAFAHSRKYDLSKLTERDHRYLRAAYWAMCDHLDVNLGRILDCLEETGQRENTVVIFTSDHGELLGDHGIYQKGPFLYDGAIRVPLIVSWPGMIPQGRRLDTMVELGDLAPTLLEAAGVPRPPGMQTQSFWELLTDDALPDRHRDDIYCEYYNSNPNPEPIYCTALRTHRHKLVVWHGQELGELYDLENDPAEIENRWADPDLAAVKLELMKRLCDRMAFTADPLPERIGIF